MYASHTHTTKVINTYKYRELDIIASTRSCSNPHQPASMYKCTCKITIHAKLEVHITTCMVWCVLHKLQSATSQPSHGLCGQESYHNKEARQASKRNK